MRVSSNSKMTDAQGKVFGAEMRRLRKKAGLTAKEFSDYVGISPNYVHNLECHSNKPSPQLAERIAKAFDVTVEDMLKPHAEMVAEERKAYGKELAKARAEKGYTASLVAGALGIAPAVYREYEQGLCSITERNVATLNTLLGIGEEEKEPEDATPVEVVEDNALDIPAGICDTILAHVTDLKVAKETQKEIWQYFSKVKLDAEARRLFG